MLKLCANGIEILKLAQTVEELHAAIFTLQVDNDEVKREVAETKKREGQPWSELAEGKFTAGLANQRCEELSNYIRRHNIRIYGVQVLQQQLEVVKILRPRISVRRKV